MSAALKNGTPKKVPLCGAWPASITQKGSAAPCFSTKAHHKRRCPNGQPLSIRELSQQKKHRQSFWRRHDSRAVIGVLSSATTHFNAFAELMTTVTVMLSMFAAFTTLAGLTFRTFPEFAVLMLPVFTPVFNDIIRRGHSDDGSLKS